MKGGWVVGALPSTAFDSVCSSAAQGRLGKVVRSGHDGCVLQATRRVHAEQKRERRQPHHREGVDNWPGRDRYHAPTKGGEGGGREATPRGNPVVAKSREQPPRLREKIIFALTRWGSGRDITQSPCSTPIAKRCHHCRGRLVSTGARSRELPIGRDTHIFFGGVEKL